MDSSWLQSVSSHSFGHVEEQILQELFADYNEGENCVETTNAAVLQASVTDPANIDELHDFERQELEQILDAPTHFAANFSKDGRSIDLTKKNVSASARKRVGSSSSRLTHNESERQRRRGLNCLFTSIRSLLPMPHAKTADKCTTISMAINYIESLQQHLEELKRKRTQLLESTSINVSTKNICSVPLSTSGCGKRTGGSMTDSDVLAMEASRGKKAKCMQEKMVYNAAVVFNANSAMITLTSLKTADIFSRVLELVEDHRLEVHTANVSKGEGVVLFSILAKVVDDKMMVKEAFSKALQGLADH